MNCSKRVLMKKRGVSLIETMIAVSVIAVLQIAVLSNVKGYVEKAKKIAVQANRENMSNNLLAYNIYSGYELETKQETLGNSLQSNDKEVLDLIMNNSLYIKQLSEILTSSDN